jgi:hypothetical protein
LTTVDVARMLYFFSWYHGFGKPSLGSRAAFRRCSRTPFLDVKYPF